MDLDKLIAGLSLEQKVGQMFMLAFAGGNSEFVRPLIEQYGLGGCYISQSNAATPAEAVALTATLQGYAAIPLLLGVDQEGAWGVLVPYSSTGPGNMALGAAGSPELAERMYAIFAAEMQAVGYNCLLAPAVDVNSNPANPIIGTRSFGEDPARVAELASAAVRGARSGGIICTAKHYPGHGDTASDSHRHLPRVERSRAELERIDLPPFRAAVAAGVDIVMTSHIIYPALDPANPATMSPAILQTLLRDEIGFGGVILSDSMNMGAIRHNYRPDEAAILAIRAGVDMVMLAEEHYDHDAARYVEKQLLTIRGVVEAVQKGHIPIATIDNAVTRILKLKSNHALFNRATREEGTASIGKNAHRAVELAAAYAAVTLVRDHNNLLPLAAGSKVALVNTTPTACYSRIGPEATRGIGPNQTRPACAAFTAALLAARPDIAQFAYEDLVLRPRNIGRYIR